MVEATDSGANNQTSVSAKIALTIGSDPEGYDPEGYGVPLKEKASMISWLFILAVDKVIILLQLLLCQHPYYTAQDQL
jgi:hypothetical protein